MGLDQYEFDAVDSDELASACRKLKGSTKSKDALVKSLKQIAGIVEKAPQDACALGQARDEVVHALAQKQLLHHTDKDVKLYLASCLAHLLRIYAPETPYEDPTLVVRKGSLLPVCMRSTTDATRTFCRAACFQPAAMEHTKAAAIQGSHLRACCIYPSSHQPGTDTSKLCVQTTKEVA